MKQRASIAIQNLCHLISQAIQSHISMTTFTMEDIKNTGYKLLKPHKT